MIAVWNACAGEDDFSRIVRLLLLCGCRRAEIGGLRWEEVDPEKRCIHLPAARVKNGRPFLIPLSDQAMDILSAVPIREGCDFLFGNASGSLVGPGPRKN
jgi:integrase